MRFFLRLDLPVCPSAGTKVLGNAVGEGWGGEVSVGARRRVMDKEEMEQKGQRDESRKGKWLDFRVV